MMTATTTVGTANRIPLEITKVRVAKIDDTVSPPEIHVHCTIKSGKEEFDYITVFSADEVDIRRRDKDGTLIIQSMD